MSNKILILGASGMLGWQITDKLLNAGEKLTLTVSNSNSAKKLRNKVNKNLKIIKIDFLKEKKVLKKIITKHNIVINCIGLIKPYIDDKNQKDIKKALNLNSLLPDYINDVIKNSNIKVYQIATDCVFSGTKGNYLENDIHDANDVYGMSKSLGEVKNENFYNLRCSIIGREINNKYSLIEWFLNNKSDDVNGFTNHFWNGISTKAYAKYLKSILINKIEIPELLHIIPNDKLTKYEMLKIFNDKFFGGRKNIIPTNDNDSIDRTLDSSFKDLNHSIWKKTDYKHTPTIKEIILDI